MRSEAPATWGFRAVGRRELEVWVTTRIIGGIFKHRQASHTWSLPDGQNAKIGGCRRHWIGCFIGCSGFPQTRGRLQVFYKLKL